VKLTLARAVRLVRADLERLDGLHRRQCGLAIGPARIEEGGVEVHDEPSEVFGLVYVRASDEAHPGRAYEGWFLDRGRFPEREATPGQGVLFRAGTLESAGAHEWPSDHFGNRISVDVVDPSATSLDLEVVLARRFTLADLEASPTRRRYQLLHALRPQRAPLYTPVTMDDPDALGVLYDFVELGPGADVRALPAHLLAHKRSGLVYLRLRCRDDTRRVFEGWFWDKLRHPSSRSVPRDGRLFLGGTVTPTGVVLERGRVRLQPGRHVADARALAAGLARVLEELRVTVGNRR